MRKRLAAAFLHAEDGLGGVVERKIFRRDEGEAELRMQEAAAAHETFARIVAVDHAVDRRDISRAIALAGCSAGAPNWRASFCAFLTRSGVAGCEERKSGARGSIRAWLAALSSALRPIELRKRTAP